MSTATTVKTIGAVWNLFYADEKAWPEGAYHEDTLLAINGKEDPDGELEKLPLGATVEILCGYVLLPVGSDVGLGEHFKNWLAEQSGQGVVFGSFRVTNEKLEAVRQAILAAGGELIE